MKGTNKTYKLDYRKVIFVVSVFVMMLLVFTSVNNRKHARIESVSIEIEPIDDHAFLVDSADVAHLIERHVERSLIGVPYSELNIENLEASLEHAPFIDNVEVFFSASQLLRVKIDQSQPKLRVIDFANRDYFLDAQGKALPISEHYTPRALVVTGDLPPFDVERMEEEGYVFSDLLTLVDYIKADPYRKALVEQIHFDGNDFILIPKVGDQKIIFGGIELMEEKFQNLIVFYEEAMPREGWNKYQTINLKYKDQVVGVRRGRV